MTSLGVEYGCKFVLEGPAPISSDNQTLNPSFETDLANWSLVAASWTEATATREAATFAGSSGGFVAALKGKKDNTATARTMSYSTTTPEGDTQPGNKYTATAAVNVIDKLESGIRLRIDWYNGGVFLSTTQGELFTGTGVTELTVPLATAPANATRATLVVVGTSAVANDTYNVQVDNVTYRENGPRAVFNDSSDPDFVGSLDPEKSSGLDSPDIREDVQDRTEDDGQVQGNNFFAGRPVVLGGVIIASSATDRNTKVGKLKASANAMRADAKLTHYPLGGPTAGVRLNVRRQQPLRITKGYVKEFQVPLYSNDAEMFSTVENVKELPVFTSGPKFAGAGATEAGIGTVAWTNPSNIKLSDNVRASVNLPKSSISNWLRGTSFGHVFPTGASMLGIEGFVEGRLASGVGQVRLTKGQIIKNGVIGGENQASVTIFPGTEAVMPIPNPAISPGWGKWHLWGNTLTKADVESANWGLAISVSEQLNIEAVVAEVDAISTTVYYTTPIEIENAGDAPADFKAVLYGPMAGPLRLINESTGEELSIEFGVLEEGATVTIDTKNRTIFLSNVFGNIYDWLEFEKSNWFKLRPGKTKLLCPNGRCVISYYDTYL